MLVYAHDQSWYWPLVVPGFVVGSLGAFSACRFLPFLIRTIGSLHRLC